MVAGVLYCIVLCGEGNGGDEGGRTGAGAGDGGEMEVGVEVGVGAGACSGIGILPVSAPASEI